MRVLEQLEPKAVFRYFEDLTQIPRPSGNTKAVSDYCVAFAKAHGLRYIQDAVNNVIIFKPATAGYENAPAVILQGHLDMVAVKEPDSPVDPMTQPLSLSIDGDFVYADGTSLGGDDGAAVAMALAVLASDDLPHPAIEAVFTVDEEIGMDGAAALDPAPLTARRLLNIDSEDEGILTVSCAGGVRANCELPLSREACALSFWRVCIDGLIGGHSGVEIHRGRGNANLLLGRFLRILANADDALRLASAAGGTMDNAITLSATAVIGASAQTDVAALAAAFSGALQNEFAVSDPNVRVTAVRCDAPEDALDADSTARVLDFLSLVPNGVQAMSMDIEGLVQTSCNLGILDVSGTHLHACSAIRSALASQKQMVYDRVAALCARLGGSVRPTGDYPGWAYLRQSPLREVMVRVFTEQYGREPTVEAIHAGLECGLFADKLEGLDAVSFGPALYDIHTTHERMSISSMQRTWEYLCQVLCQLKD